MRHIALLILAAVSTSVQSAPEQPDGWSAYGGDPGGSRYSSLTQITAKNVSDLKVAWTVHTGERGQGECADGSHGGVTVSHRLSAPISLPPMHGSGRRSKRGMGRKSRCRNKDATART